MNNWPDWLPLRDELRSEVAYGAPQIDVPIRLNTNENPFPLSSDISKAIAKRMLEVIPNLNRYPDRDAVELREKLATYINRNGTSFTWENVWAANGSNEIIQQIFQAFGGSSRKAIGFTPSYSMHPIIARTTQTPWIAGFRNSKFEVSSASQQIKESGAEIIFLTSPNNPTGTTTSRNEIEQIAAEFPSKLVVVDEAYAEFLRTPSESAINSVGNFKNVIVIRTMSKAFGLAGARVGYLVAHPKIVQALMLVRLPYHLGAHTQEIAKACLEHSEELLLNIEVLKQQRERIISELTKLGLAPFRSDANFVLFGGLDDARAAWNFLLNRGVLIRDVGLDGMLRVTAGTPEETTIFLEAIADYLKEGQQ